MLMAGVLTARTRVRRRDHWDRDQLLTYQRRRLDRLVRHAISRSAYYRERVGPLRGASLEQLPVLTKETLMNEWDRVCTEPSLSLDSVEQQLRSIEESGGDPAHGWRGRWWLAATGGTTGRRASLVWDRREWAQVLASYARVNDWAEVDLDLRHPVRTAIVSSLNPTHQSAVVGASLRSHMIPALRLDARAPMPDLVAELNAFEPRLLVAFASMVGPLAVAQLEGRLRIAPEKVVAASEALSDAARAAAQAAWGQRVVIDSYAATESASIASTCAQGGWHLYEDFVIAEPVDDEYRPVPVGRTGRRLLVTPLFSRTLPLIRYELTDSVRLSSRICTCGRPFALLGSVEGRTEDTLVLVGAAGPVRVHPVVFHTALESSAPGGWQVEQLPDRLLVRLIGTEAAPDAARARLLQALSRLGLADVHVDVEVADAPVRTALGKAPLVKAHKNSG